MRGKADVANACVRIFLQDFGREYDKARGLVPYSKGKHFAQIRDFFGERCCYCGAEFGGGVAATEDHLIALNKTALGLHAWGNIVPACGSCNSKKQGKP